MGARRIISASPELPERELSRTDACSILASLAGVIGRRRRPEPLPVFDPIGRSAVGRPLTGSKIADRIQTWSTFRTA